MSLFIACVAETLLSGRSSCSQCFATMCAVLYANQRVTVLLSVVCSVRVVVYVVRCMSSENLSRLGVLREFKCQLPLSGSAGRSL